MVFYVRNLHVIVCVCRNIREADFETPEQMIERIMQLDHSCGQCQDYVQKLKELLYEVE
jgi:hypothetical protein